MNVLKPLLVLSLCLLAQAGEWMHLYGEEGNQRANAVVATVEGGFTFVGATTLPNKERGDLWLMGVDSSGAERWRFQWGDKRWGEEGHAVVQSADSTYVLAGVRQPLKVDKKRQELTGLILQVSAQGRLLTTQVVPGVSLRCALKHETRIYLGGWFQAGGGAWLGQLDERGQLLWSRRIGLADSTQLNAMASLDSGHLVLAGSRESAGAWCAVVDTLGDVQDEYCGGRPFDNLRAVAVHRDAIIAVGATSDRSFIGRRVNNDLVLKFDHRCRVLDSRQLKRREFEQCSAVVVSDSTVICTGFTADDPAILGATIGIQLAAWDSQLKLLGQGRYDGLHYGSGKALLALPSGEVLVAGLAHRDARDDDSQAILFKSSLDEILRLR